MNIIIPINNINDKNIYFHDPIKNTVINNGDFIRILYTDKFIICNGLQIKFNGIPTKDNIEKLYAFHLYVELKLSKMLLLVIH